MPVCDYPIRFSALSLLISCKLIVIGELENKFSIFVWAPTLEQNQKNFIKLISICANRYLRNSWGHWRRSSALQKSLSWTSLSLLFFSWVPSWILKGTTQSSTFLRSKKGRFHLLAFLLSLECNPITEDVLADLCVLGGPSIGNTFQPSRKIWKECWRIGSKIP